jgi:hypothetical protein
MNSSEVGRRGIGGWLALYIYSSLIISIAFGGMTLLVPYQGIATRSTLLDMDIDIGACVLLLLKHRWAVQTTGISLIFSFAIGTAWFVHESLQAHSISGWPSLLVSLAQIMLWLGYFRRSHRVRNIYGRNL